MSEKRTIQIRSPKEDGFGWQVPQCCKEGWENCPHVTKKPKPKRRNVGL